MLFSTQQRLRLVSLALLTVITACSENDNTGFPSQPFILINATGDITPKLNEFRHLLGDQLNTTPGAVGGRREISWDGVPAEFLDKKLPEDFFNPTEPGSSTANQRGLKYSPTGSFQVSANGFAAVNPGAADEFAAFSGSRTFSNVGGKLWDVEFQVAGQTIAAGVQGFGIVFADVDHSNSSFLEFFNGDKSLGKFMVPAQTSVSKFSFVGVWFRDEKITRVRVSHEGQLDEGKADVSDGGPDDLIIMDDFLYSEPVAN